MGLYIYSNFLLKDWKLAACTIKSAFVRFDGKSRVSDLDHIVPGQTHMVLYSDIVTSSYSAVCVYDITLCSVLARWVFCEPVVGHQLVHLQRVLCAAISTTQSLRQSDAGGRMIRCCLTSTQYGTCVSSVGQIAGFGNNPTLCSSKAICVLQGCVCL